MPWTWQWIHRKDVLGAIDMHRYSGEEVRVLFLTRDPRGSIWSKIKHQPDHPDRAREIDKEAGRVGTDQSQIHAPARKYSG